MSAGDTVYFSGGPTASSQTYTVPHRRMDAGGRNNRASQHNHIQLYLNVNYTFSPNLQHADVLQNNANQTKVYGNWFENIEESIWFHDSLAQYAYSDLQFYNNVITQNFPVSISGVARGLDFEPQDNGKSTFRDCHKISVSIFLQNRYSGGTRSSTDCFPSSVRTGAASPW